MIFQQQPHRSSSQASGFTLVEVLIVVGIFAIISAVSYSALSQYIRVSEKLELKQQQMQNLQRAFSLMERDFRYMVSRSVRDEYGNNEPAFLSEYANGLPGETVRFTTVLQDYELPEFGRLQRVAWRIDDSSLFRDNWKSLDRTEDDPVRSFTALTGVSAFEIVYFSWSDSSGIEITDFETGDEQIPFAIKVSIEMESGDQYYRLFDIANGT